VFGKDSRGQHLLPVMMKQTDSRGGRASDQRFLTWGARTPWESIDFNGSLNLDGGGGNKILFSLIYK